MRGQSGCGLKHEGHDYGIICPVDVGGYWIEFAAGAVAGLAVTPAGHSAAAGVWRGTGPGGALGPAGRAVWRFAVPAGVAVGRHYSVRRRADAAGRGNSWPGWRSAQPGNHWHADDLPGDWRGLLVAAGLSARTGGADRCGNGGHRPDGDRSADAGGATQRQYQPGAALGRDSDRPGRRYLHPAGV
ncbi:hypothetical protein D3C78_1204610 [compost metagenome]